MGGVVTGTRSGNSTIARRDQQGMRLNGTARNASSSSSPTSRSGFNSSSLSKSTASMSSSSSTSISTSAASSTSSMRSGSPSGLPPKVKRGGVQEPEILKPFAPVNPNKFVEWTYH